MLILQFILAHLAIEIISRIRIFRRESKQDLVIHPNVVRLSSNEALLQKIYNFIDYEGSTKKPTPRFTNSLKKKE